MGSSLRIDCPPRCKAEVGNPSIPLWVTEGVKKADALASQGLCAIDLAGVWGFKGKNKQGGITILADWDNIALNGRKVYIVFDSDVIVKPEVGKALARLTEHLHRKGAEVFHVILPNNSQGKVGVDDFLLTHNPGDLINLAVKPPSSTCLNKTIMTEETKQIIQDVISTKLTPIKGVMKLRDIKKVPYHKIRQAISVLVIVVLKKYGKFIKAPEGRFYFDSTRKHLFELDSFEFGSILTMTFGLNQTESEFKFTVADVNVEAHENGQQMEVRRFAYYNPISNRLYIDRFDGSALRLNGSKIETVDNGTDGVLFSRQLMWKPYNYIEDVTPNGLLESVLVRDIPFKRDAFAPLSPNQQRMVFTLWIFGLFFESILPTKPILTLVREKGSGKTSAFRRVLRLLFGPDADVTGLERDREDAFVAAITHGYLVVLDNLDGKIAWINDRLALAATSSLVERRRLYTTNEVAIYQPKCFIGITARNPQFKRDDVADRLILLKVERLETFSEERALLDKIDSQRDMLWTELLNDLNSIIASFQQITGNPRAKFRMSDWATLCWRIAELQEVGDEFDTILERLAMEQSLFTLEDDPLYQCLCAWLENSVNVGRIVSSRTLYGELAKIAEDEQIDWSYKSPISLGKRLNNVKSNLEQLLQLRVEANNRGRTFYIFGESAVNDEVTG